VEAMAKGVPVICSDVSGNNDLIEHEQNGLLYPLQNVKDLIKSIIRLIEAPELKGLLTTNARNEFLKKYHISVCVENYLKLYESILE
jgi:glycosyltransferase involved in cell wall biosynthesis